MSALRHRFRLVLDGTKYELATSARDMATAEIDPAKTNPQESTFRLLHAACLRLEFPDIPSDWRDFADLIDDIDDLEPDEGGDDADPTLEAG